jgi:DNA-binding NarL/FixJ family response regulator
LEDEPPGSEQRAVRVLLVADHVAFREALAFLLGRGPDIEVVAQAGSPAEARKALDGRLDLGLPDGDGGELIGEPRRASPGASVLVLSAAVGLGGLDDVREAGADAVLAKVESPPIIAQEVRRLAGG